MHDEQDKIICFGVKMPGNRVKNIIKDFMFKVSKPQLSKIHKFKDIHKGEDGYFFGNGISTFFKSSKP